MYIAGEKQDFGLLHAEAYVVLGMSAVLWCKQENGLSSRHRVIFGENFMVFLTLRVLS
jgi:hypothetical protein